MKRPSIAWRLAIGLTIMTALLWLGATAIAGLVMQRELDSAYDQLLEQAAYRILPLAMHRIREPGEDDELRIGGLSDREDDEYFAYYVVRKTGAVVIRAEDVPDSIVTRTIPDGFSASDGRRVFALTDGRSGYQLIFVHSLRARQASGSLIEGARSRRCPLISMADSVRQKAGPS